jgi:hypothetical protein
MMTAGSLSRHELLDISQPDWNFRNQAKMRPRPESLASSSSSGRSSGDRKS